MNSLKSIISHIPHSPGVYQFLNFEGEVIYVGKAIDLKKRVSSYFRKQKSIPVRLRKLVENTVDLQYTVVDSELEALILETNLIKSYRPRYNVLMKDDKNYVYVKVTVNEPFPRAYVARQLKRDGARYFGPKSSSGKVKEILKVLKKAFAYRHCDLFIDLRGKESRLSRDEKFIAEHERRCLGPCILGADRSEYDRVVEQTIAFFEGKTDAIINQIKKQMGEAVEGRDFERAAQIRDRLQAIEGLMATQRVISSDHASRDVIGLALEGGAAYATLFMFREGKLLSQENFKLNAVDFESGAELADDEVLDSFLKQYYEKAADFPSEVLLPQGIQNEEVFEVWLSSLVDRSIKLITPKRGKNRKLIDLANENALSFAKQSQVKWQAGAGQDAAAAMQGLKELLDLARLPNRIECYDISHLGGVDTVGSMVVFEKGFPKKVDYRHFKLRTVQEKIDDYKAMGEVLERRLRYLKTVPDYLRKPKKKEMMDIHRLLDREELDCTELNPHKMLIAEKKGKIVGVGRLKPLDEEVSELASLWVDPKFRGEGLGQELVLALLAKQKNGKVYALPSPELIDWYGALGFNEARDLPSELKNKTEACHQRFPKDKITVMIYRFIRGDGDKSFKRKPDLLVIDGGKGQLGVVVKALKNANLKIPVVSLAKREEEIFIPGKSHSLILPESSDELQLLQRLRDEAHRFALKYQRNLRGKRMLS